jgi:hypothetical protein
MTPDRAGSKATLTRIASERSHNCKAEQKHRSPSCFASQNCASGAVDNLSIGGAGLMSQAHAAWAWHPDRERGSRSAKL